MESNKILHVGERIKYIRKLNSKTQLQFAEILGISQASLSEIETGKSKPMFDTLIKLGSDYHIDMNWLLSNIGAEDLATFQENEINLIKKYRLLVKIAQEDIDDYLDLKLKRFNKNN